MHPPERDSNKTEQKGEQGGAHAQDKLATSPPLVFPTPMRTGGNSSPASMTGVSLPDFMKDFPACGLFLSSHSLKAYGSPERTNDGSSQHLILDFRHCNGYSRIAGGGTAQYCA